MKAYLAHIQFEFRNAVRDRSLLLMNYLFPLVVYLIIGSFGTVSGILAVRDNPELYAAYIGTGQVVNQVKAEQLGYQYCLDKAAESNNRKAIQELKDICFPVNGSYNSEKFPTTYESIGIERKWLGTFGGVTKDPKVLMPMMMSCVVNKEHPFFQSLQFMGRFKKAMNVLWPQVMDIDFTTLAPELKVPVFFFEGRYDMDAAAVLAEEYFNLLQAPVKEFYWFENSGHMPTFEEPERFINIVKEHILPGCISQSGTSIPSLKSCYTAFTSICYLLIIRT